MNLLKTLLVIGICSAFLSACEKPKQVQSEKTQEHSTVLPITENQNSNNDVKSQSPTLFLWVKGIKFAVNGMINSSQKINDSQKSCLEDENNIENYLQEGRLSLTKAMEEDGLKIADDFYRTPEGQKVIQITEQQLLNLQNKPAGEPITLTDEEEKKIDEFLQSDVAKKAETNVQKIDSKEMQVIFEKLIKLEKQRCNI